MHVRYVGSVVDHWFSGLLLARNAPFMASSWQSYDTMDVLNRVSAAWDSMEADAMVLILCGITAAIDGSEDDRALVENSDEEPLDLARS